MALPRKLGRLPHLRKVWVTVKYFSDCYLPEAYNAAFDFTGIGVSRWQLYHPAYTNRLVEWRGECGLLALRDISLGRRIRSLSEQSGHGSTCCWLDPVANDPKATCGQIWP